MTPLRSVLYVPASNARAIEKARSLPCDAVILDLEDAVAPEAKASARDAAVEALRTGGFSTSNVGVRPNAFESEWGFEDIEAVLPAGPSFILQPKIRTSVDMISINIELESAPAHTQLWLMVETAASIINLRTLCQEGAGGRLAGLVLGLNDLRTELRCRATPGRKPFHLAMSSTVAHARAYGWIALDAVFNDLEDAAGLQAECRQARDFGFDGKTLIHPRQIEAANRAFSPSEEDLAWSRAVVAAFADPANAGRGALRVNGAMVERLHLAEAERMLAFEPGG